MRLAATVLSDRFTESPPKKSNGLIGVFAFVSDFPSFSLICFLGLGVFKNISSVDFLGFSSSVIKNVKSYSGMGHLLILTWMKKHHNKNTFIILEFSNFMIFDQNKKCFKISWKGKMIQVPVGLELMT